MLKRLTAGGTILMIALEIPSPSYAQTASQITPPSFAPPPPQVDAPIVIPQGLGAQAPAGAEAIELHLGDVIVEGAAVDPRALGTLRETLVGHPIKLTDVFAAARALEADFARHGHLLTRVTVPAQSLDKGATLKLVVVQGFIERVDVTGLPRQVQRRVAATLASLQGSTDMSQADLERRLLLAADVPGVALRSTLAAGEKPGGTVLVVEGSYRPIGVLLSVDNSLPSALDGENYAIGITLNGVLGAGETVYLRAAGIPNVTHDNSFLDPAPRNRMLAAGAIVPIGHDGLRLNLEGTDARTAPRHANTAPGFGTHFKRLSTRVSYPFIRSRAINVVGEVSFDVQDEKVRIIAPLTLPISLDRLRVLRSAVDGRAALPGNGSVRLRAEISAGIDALGARSAADATPLQPLSRAGTDADFQKLTVDAGIEQPLARHLALSASGHAQTSFGQVMANAEQIGIASADGLSPLYSGTLQGDSGYIVRGEIQTPFDLRTSGLFARLAPYGFAAHGQVHLEQPTVVERRNTGATAYGVGLRLNGQAAGSSAGLSASLEYGRAKIEGIRRETDRVSFSILTQF
jgi:hemolysin activation/secretion protein